MSKGRSFRRYLGEANKIAVGAFLLVLDLTWIVFVNTIIIGDWVKIGLTLAAIIFYFVPDFISYKFKLHLPVTLMITYYLFIFAALILGEVFAFYGPFPFWDVILHFLSGFVLAGIGLSIVEIVNKDVKSKIFTLLFAFCFSITLGVMWECLEFTFDVTFRTDAQKDAHLNNISTITMQRDGGNRPVRVDNIVKTEMFLENGEVINVDEGYLDIGLMDTMKDLLVNTAGAALFCVVGAAYLKKNHKAGLAEKFIPTKTS